MTKVLRLQQGGHPLKNDNFDHLQDAFTEAFDAIVKALAIDSEPGYKLSGCVVTYSTTSTTDDTANWTAGWIVINGEILQVDAGGPVVKTGLLGFRWSIQESTEGPDPQSYADGSTPDVHKVRKAVIVASTLTLSHVLADAPYLKDVLHPNYEEENTSAGDWNAEHDINGAVAWTVSSSEMLVRRANKQMELNVRVIASTLAAAATYLDITIPDGYTALSVFTGTAYVNQVPFRVQTLTGGSAIRIYNESGTWSGAVTVQFTLRFEIE